MRTGHHDPTVEAERLARARLHRQYLHVGGRVRALDWDNVGTVVAIADHTGTCWVNFVSEDGRHAVKWMRWADIRPLDHPDPVDITDAANSYFELADAALAEQVAAWNQALAEHGIAANEPVVVPAAIATPETTAPPPPRRRPARLAPLVARPPTT